MERENQRIVLTKRMLKDSLLKLLQEKSVDMVNVAELCREAGINRATFYRHYDIPRDVLMEIQRDFYREMRDQIELPKTAEGLAPVIKKVCMHLYDHLELLRILIRSNSDLDFANFIYEMYLDLGKDLCDMDMVKKLSPEDMQFVALYSAGGSYFVLRNWIMSPAPRSPEEVAEHLCSLAGKTEQLLISLIERQ